MRRALVMTVMTVLLGMGQGQAAPGDAVPFTQGDRDTLMRLEARSEGLDQRFQDQVKHLDQRFLDQEKRMDQRFLDQEKAMDQRFQAMDQRFQAMDQRFVDFQKAMDQRFVDSQKALDKRFEALDQRFVSLDKRMESLERFLTILASIFTPLIVAFIAFVIWDRWTFLREAREQADLGARKITEEAIREPVAKVNQTQETLTAILDALRQWGEQSPEFREILKRAHLL